MGPLSGGCLVFLGWLRRGCSRGTIAQAWGEHLLLPEEVDEHPRAETAHARSPRWTLRNAASAEGEQLQSGGPGKTTEWPVSRHCHQRGWCSTKPGPADSWGGRLLGHWESRTLTHGAGGAGVRFLGPTYSHFQASTSHSRHCGEALCTLACRVLKAAGASHVHRHFWLSQLRWGCSRPRVGGSRGYH